MDQDSVAGRQSIMVAVVVVALVLSAGLASAAVSGSFSSSYDGWDDGTDSEAAGHEISVSGTVEVTGDSAVDPRIVIRGADRTILDKSSVQVFVEGDRSIQFDRVVRESSVVYRADEIPAGTTLQVEYVAYYIGGADAGEVTVGNVNVNYETPGGTSQRETFPTQNALEDRPENVIESLKEQTSQGQTLSTAQQILSYVGILAVLYIVLKALLGLRDDKSEGI